MKLFTFMDLRGGLLSRFKWVRILRSETSFSPETNEEERVTTTTVITRASKKLTLLQLAAMVKETQEEV